MTREDRESEIADYVEYLDALYDEVAATRRARRRPRQRHRVLAGRGDGDAVGHARPRRASSDSMLWGGLMPPETDLSRGPGAMRGARLTLVVGDRAISTSTTRRWRAEQARLDAAGIPYDVIRFDGGHAIKPRACFHG